MSSDHKEIYKQSIRKYGVILLVNSMEMESFINDLHYKSLNGPVTKEATTISLEMFVDIFYEELGMSDAKLNSNSVAEFNEGIAKLIKAGWIITAYCDKIDNRIPKFY